MRAGPRFFSASQHILPLPLLLLIACSDNPLGTKTPLQGAPHVWEVISESLLLNAVMTFDDGSGVAVAPGGHTFMRSGGQWSPGPAAPGDATMNDVWGVGVDDLYAVGDGGRILHFDGVTWTDMTSSTSVDLDGVWGTSTSDVFAVGARGMILHYDGAEWARMTSGTQNALHAVHGTGPDQVFAVGDFGTFAEYNGTSWRLNYVGSNHFLSVYASDPAHVIAVGASGRVAKRIEGVWTSGYLGSYPLEDWRSVHGTLPDDMYVCGGRGSVYHYDGESWVTIQSGSADRFFMSDVCSTDSVVVVVGDYTRILEYAEGVWRKAYEATIPSRTLYSVWQSGDGDALIAASKTVWRIAGNEVTAYTVSPDLVTAIWGSGMMDIFAVGGSGVISHFDGTAWAQQSTHAGHPYFRAVYGMAPDDVLAVGEEVVHYNGTQWESVPLPAALSLYGVWGSGYLYYVVVGRQGAVWLYTGAQWWELDSGTQEDLLAVWGSSWSNVVAVGTNGTILHYDGSAWTLMESGTIENLRSVWGRSASDIYVAGGHGGLPGDSDEPVGVALHFDGREWETIGTSTETHFFAVAGDSNETTWAGGSGVFKYHQ